MSRRSDGTREAILAAARERWFGAGFNGAGLEQIAEAAGVTRRTVYLHFSSKAALLLAVVREVEVAAGLPELVGRLALTRTGIEAIDALGEIQVQYLPKVYNSIRLMHSARLEEPVANEVWLDRMAGRRTVFRMLAEGMAERGELLPDLSVEDAVMIIWALTSPHMYEYLVIDGGWSVEHFRSHLVRLLRRALLRQPAT